MIKSKNDHLIESYIFQRDAEKALNGYSKLIDILNKLKQLEEEIKAYDQN